MNPTDIIDAYSAAWSLVDPDTQNTILYTMKGKGLFHEVDILRASMDNARDFWEGEG